MKLKLIGCETYAMVSFMMVKGNVKEFSEPAGRYLLGQVGNDGKTLFVEVSEDTPEILGPMTPPVARRDAVDDDGDFDSATANAKAVAPAPSDLVVGGSAEDEDEDLTPGDLVTKGGAKVSAPAPVLDADPDASKEAAKAPVVIKAKGKASAPAPAADEAVKV